MKKLLTLIFCLSFVSLHAQTWPGWGYNHVISFDSMGVPYQNLIAIDTLHYHSNIWQVGKPHKAVFDSSYSSGNVIVTDTLNPCPANDTSVFILKLPEIVYMSSSILWPGEIGDIDFMYQLDKDSNSIARFEISEDNGANWINIKDSLPYTFYWLDSPVNLSQSTSGWKHFHFSLNLANWHDSVQFRFTYVSDSSSSLKDGWMIDDINVLYYWWESVPHLQNDNLISIYPNPTKGNIFLHSPKPPSMHSSICVYNMLGQEVYTTDKVSQNCYLNLPLPDGVYTLKYMQDDEYCVKRIVIEQ